MDWNRESKMSGFSKKQYKEEQNKTRGNDIWEDQEKRAAKAFKGKRTIGSGSKPFHKGDVNADSFLVECKSFSTSHTTIKLEWLEKISKEAFGCNKDPAMHFLFDLMTCPTVDKEWVMIPVSVFKRMVDNVESKN